MNNISYYLKITLLITIAGFIYSCEDYSLASSDLDYSLGWNGEDDLDNIPLSTNFGFGNGNLPSSINLVPKFPPIGNQGEYGTCVSWALAYNIKTATNGMKEGLSNSELSDTYNQFSPKDLFLAIPDSEKGQNCNGTNFSNALEVLQNRGVARMQTVPYDFLGDCSQSNLEASWTNEANQHKIQYWRRIEPNILSIKKNLANNIPIILGARLADNFMSWNTDNVISSGTSYNNVGQHAYHAMVIAGYDDNKGAAGAFKVINTWGDFWGDEGYIWIDYNYMINEFCTSSNGDKPLFIVADVDTNTSPPNDPDPIVSGVDLAPWIVSDYSIYENTGIETERQINFNIYNIGNQTASPSSDWSIYYIYYNAYDANDYGIIFYDYFNTSIAADSYTCLAEENCIFNYSIASGDSFAEIVFDGAESVGRRYLIPEISGDYYLVLIADFSDEFNEENELNNLFYTTSEPKHFDNGYSSRLIEENIGMNDRGYFEFFNEEIFDRNLLETNQFNSGISNDFKNAYTEKEILEFLKKEIQMGNILNKENEIIQISNNDAYAN